MATDFVGALDAHTIELQISLLERKRQELGTSIDELKATLAKMSPASGSKGTSCKSQARRAAIVLR